ncbi:MAG: HupE/UreJ family protein [Hyphomicrobiaceae bacterium]
MSPPAFISAMTIAGVMGAAGLRTPYVEVGIALSVVFLDLAIALGLSVSVFTAMALVGAFALFHGYAHGAEMADGLQLPIARGGQSTKTTGGLLQKNYCFRVGMRC